MNGSGTWNSPPHSLAGTSPNKTSSLPSSFQLDEGGILSDLGGHFEEIGLGDDHEEGQRPKTSSRQLQRGSTSALSSLRDLTVKRPSYPTLQPHIHQVHSTDHLGLPNSSRRFISPSSPGGGRRSRNSSPGPQSCPQSPGLPATSLAPSGSSVRSPSLPVHHKNLKRTTGTNRKTVEELEKEYDSDDDIPPDTIFWNIPISPRGGRSVSYSSSPTDRDLSVHTNGTTTPKIPSPPPIDSQEYNGRDALPRSWSDAVVNELSAEAKELTEALEKHAEEEKILEEKRRQNTGQKTKPRSRAPSPVRSKTIDLPPLQTSNGMIDPLPISKEKEAVLSRTRPSWLPPKSKEEEKRHLREYQKMMQLSREAEKKRLEKEKKEQEQRDRMRVDIHRVWEKHILPEWEKMISRPETRELWWRGVAPRCRGAVWAKAFGNSLAISEDTFRLALKRAKAADAEARNSPSVQSTRDGEMFSAIRRDVNDTFPDLKIFQEQAPLHQSLLDVLFAYSMYRSDVGYVYGTHVIAAILLLNATPIQSFSILVNLLNRPVPLAFYTQDEGAISKIYTLFLKAFRYKLPKLFDHIHVTLALPPPAYLEAMFSTLFSLHIPLDITSRIWDVYAFEGDAFLVRTAIGVLTALESRLYGSRDEVVALLGWRAGVWGLGKEDDFLAVVRDAGKEEKEVPVAENDKP